MSGNTDLAERFIASLEARDWAAWARYLRFNTDFWPEPYEPPPGREHLVERW
jgi:hypothetical protein